MSGRSAGAHNCPIFECPSYDFTNKPSRFTFFHVTALVSCIDCTMLNSRMNEWQTDMWKEEIPACFKVLFQFPEELRKP
jgi:hypothetical protein